MNPRTSFPLADIKFNQPFDPKKVKELLTYDIPQDDRKLLVLMSKLEKPILECKLEPPKHGWGRYRFSKSLMNLSRKSRHFICSEDYYDIDMVKSQPNILNAYFEMNDIECESLQRYVINPDKKIAKVISKFDLKPIKKDDKYYSPKDIAKQLFNSLCNGGSLDGWMNEFSLNMPDNFDISYITQFRMEIQDAIEKARDLEPDLNAFAMKHNSGKDYKAINNSFSAFLYQEIETRIIEQIFGTEDKEFVAVYCLDGFMVPKKHFENTIDKFLEVCTKKIVKEYGEEYASIKFIVKPMDEAWTPEYKLEEEKEEYDHKEYDLMKLEFEKDNSHFYLEETKQYYKKGINQYIPHSFNEFRNATAHLRIKVDSKLFPFLTLWNQDEQKLKYLNFTYDLHQQENTNYINLFTGFEILKHEPLIEPITVMETWNTYIKVVSGNDSIVESYLTNWITRIIQQPWNPNSVALLLQSNAEGSGKSTLGIAISSILGSQKYNFIGTGFNELFPKDGFNDYLQDCIVYTADELDGVDARNNNSNFKKFCTSDTLLINAKGKSKFEIPKKINLICTSNNLNPLPMGEKARRILPIQVSDELIGYKEFWDKFYDMLKDKNCCRSLYDFFKSLDISKWNPSAIPETELTTILKEANTDPLEQIITDNLEYLHTLGNFRPIDILNRINSGFEKGKLHSLNSVSLGLKLAKSTFCRKLFVKSTIRKGGTWYSLNEEVYNELKKCQIDEQKADGQKVVLEKDL